MARRVLSARAGLLALGLCALSCRHHEQAAPTPSAEPASSAAETARAARFALETKRSRDRLQFKPDLSECAKLLTEGSDLELCTGSERALSAVQALPEAAPSDLAIKTLADAALALARLAERARYQSFLDLGELRLHADGGAPTPANSAPAPANSSLRLNAPFRAHGERREQASLKVSESPTMRLAETAARQERETLRDLGAYLEYAPLPVRRSAYEAMKRLLGEHPRWPSLLHLLHEASVIESDGDLKHDLSALIAAARLRGRPSPQPTDSK